MTQVLLCLLISTLFIVCICLVGPYLFVYLIQISISVNSIVISVPNMVITHTTCKEKTKNVFVDPKSSLNLFNNLIILH